MEYTAKHRYADMSARKIRPFADMIRGMHADDALMQLQTYHNKSARLLEKVVKSAVGNFEDRGTGDADDLIVSVARIDDAPMMKRIRPRARGMAFQIKKRFSHIIVALSDGVGEGGEE